MASVTNDAMQQAQAFFNAGNYRRCRELVAESLSRAPDDIDLLRLAGRCALELNAGDAAPYLQKVVNLRPDDVDSWRDLGDALMEEGNLGEAAASLSLQSGFSPRFKIVAIPDEQTVTGSQSDIFRHYGISMEGLTQTALALLR